MNKIKITWLIVGFLLMGSTSCVKKESKHPNSSGFYNNIIPQKNTTRKYVSISLPLISEIDLVEIDPPLFMPTFLQIDEGGFVYTLSWRNFRIYRISLGDDYKKKDLLVFGKGRGQGPGELSQPMDLKVLDGRIYISDQNTGSLEIYSTSGEYIKRSSFLDEGQPIFPVRIVPENGGIVIQTYRFKRDKLFSLCDYEGLVIENIGNHFNREWTSLVLLDGQTSNVFSFKRFYYFPLYLGFTYLYDGQKLVFMKETIDGLRNMSVQESDYSQEKAKKYMTARSFALGSDFIMVIARDREEKINYWDVYRLNDFTYLFSIKEPPPAREIAIAKKFMVCLDIEKLAVYGMDDLLLQVKKHIQALVSSSGT